PSTTGKSMPLTTEKPLPPLTLMRFKKLVAMLVSLTEKQWTYATFVESWAGGCGTVCCAAGWLPSVDPHNWVWVRNAPEGQYLSGSVALRSLYEQCKAVIDLGDMNEIGRMAYD